MSDIIAPRGYYFLSFVATASRWVLYKRVARPFQASLTTAKTRQSCRTTIATEGSDHRYGKTR